MPDSRVVSLFPAKPVDPQAVTLIAQDITASKDYEQARALLYSAIWAVSGRLSRVEAIRLLESGLEDLRGN